MTGSEILSKVKEIASADRVQTYYRLYMTGASFIIMILSGAALWGLNYFIGDINTGLASNTAQMAQISASFNGHVQADIQERGAINDRFGNVEGRIGRVEQNRDDVAQMISRTSADRDRQLSALTDAVTKLTEQLGQTRSDVSEIKGKLEVLLPDRTPAVH
jgi:hypothetical protein